MDENFYKKSRNTLQKRWYHFMKWHFITFWRNILISHKPSENYWDKIQEFLCYNIMLRSKYSFELNSIANMDEAPLYLNMPLFLTLQVIRSKRVDIKIQRQENCGSTAILTFIASREKIITSLIFKAQEEKHTEFDCKK